jgi:hypothetical protein
MTLNKLAWEMWEKLGYEGIDPSVLSKIINGERFFSLKQLKIFCQILNLKNNEKETLKDIYYDAMSKKFGWDESISSLKNKYLVDFVSDNLNKIRTVRQKGLPKLSVEWAEEVGEHLFEKSFLVQNLPTKKKLLELFADIMMEQWHGATEMKSSKGVTMEISNKLSRIAEENRDYSFKVLSRHLWGRIGYLDNNYSKAAEVLRKDFDYLNPYQQYISLRNLLISSAYLGNITFFEKVRVRFMSSFHQYSISDQGSIHESIGRGEGILGLTKRAEKSIAIAKDYFQKNKKLSQDQLVLKNGQITRAILETALNREKYGEKNYLERTSKQSIDDLGNLGYLRYKSEINGLYSRLIKQ